MWTIRCQGTEDKRDEEEPVISVMISVMKHYD